MKAKTLDGREVELKPNLLDELRIRIKGTVLMPNDTGYIAWPASKAPKVLEMYRTHAEKASSELTLAVLLRPAPPAPWLPKKWHGKAVALLVACYTGNPKMGEQIVAPFKSFGNPIADILVRRPYTQMQSLLDATQPKGRRCYWKSEYLANIEPA